MVQSQMTIDCDECEKKKKEIEAKGASVVISCKPVPDIEQPPSGKKQCRIVWDEK